MTHRSAKSSSLGTVLNVQLGLLSKSLSALMPDELGPASSRGINGRLVLSVSGATEPAQKVEFEGNTSSLRPTCHIHVRRFSISLMILLDDRDSL
jgi:hypothetical protein